MFRFAKTIINSLFSKPKTRKTQRAPFNRARGHIDIDIDKCSLCGACSKQCPVGAIEVNRENGSWEIDRYRCIVCEYCAEKCPKKCLKVDNNFTKASSEKTKYKATKQGE